MERKMRDYHEDPNGYGLSSHVEVDNNGGPEHYGDSRSEHYTHDYMREPSRSRDKDREKGHDRVRDKDQDGERDRNIYRDGDRERGKDRGRERDKDRDHYRVLHRDQSDKGNRGRDDEDLYRGRMADRRGYDHEREHKHRRISRSCSSGRSDHISRSPSHSQSRRRISGFDMAPPASALLPTAAAFGGQFPSLTPEISGVFPNMLSLTTVQQMGIIPMMPVQAMTQQATRHARRVYVGGLSPSANEQSVALFFNHVMATIGGNTAGPDAVVNVYINHEKKFAFVELRSVEEASNAMALDGIIFEGTPVKVRRPGDYNPSLAATLGPSQPNPNLNLAAVVLMPGFAGALEGPDRIFVGGLPHYFTEVQILVLLEPFGQLRRFDLVKDRETGNSKGYAFCVYHDPAVTDIACAVLNGFKMGDKTLTVRRANQGATQTKPEQESVYLHLQQQVALQKQLLEASMGGPSRVICLTNVVSAYELRDDAEYDDIMVDMREEGKKFGSLMNVVIPRPGPDAELTPGVGKVFLEYLDVDGSTKARAGMNGRKFGGKEVLAVFYPEDKFVRGI